MSKVWHISTPDDGAATLEASLLASAAGVEQVHVSWSFGNGPAIVVVRADDSVNVAELANYPAVSVTQPLSAPTSTVLQFATEYPATYEPVPSAGSDEGNTHDA